MFSKRHLGKMFIVLLLYVYTSDFPRKNMCPGRPRREIHSQPSSRPGSLDSVNAVRTVTFEGSLNLWKQKEVCRSQVGPVRDWGSVGNFFLNRYSREPRAVWLGALLWCITLKIMKTTEQSCRKLAGSIEYRYNLCRVWRLTWSCNRVRSFTPQRVVKRTWD